MDVKLSATNASMPIIGLGTWQAKPEEIEIAIKAALDVGYRHFDTAFSYNNEEIIGKILEKELKERNMKRSEIFITTKLPHIATRASDVERFLRMSLHRLQMEYVDLYLVHIPFGFLFDESTLSSKVNENGYFELDLATDHIALWKAMESVVEKGLAKHIGLSNFNKKQIENINENAKIKPQVLQIEYHPYLQQEDLKQFCDKHNIIITAYSPLGSPGALNHFKSKYDHTIPNLFTLLEDPVIIKVATNHNKSAAQVALRFLIQNNVTVIPKSSNPIRIKENYDIFNFELTAEEIDSIKNLDRGENGRIINFSFWKGCERHPCFPF